MHAKKGRELHAAGRSGAALEAFEEAWLCNKDPLYAEKAFIIACNMRALGKARVFWRRMSPGLQERTMGVCVRNQITEEMLDAL